MVYRIQFFLYKYVYECLINLNGIKYHYINKLVINLKKEVILL